MKGKRRETAFHEAHDTTRRTIMAELELGPRSGRDLSAAAGIPEREVYAHLEHIRKSVLLSGRRLVVSPAACRKCGFVFTKRERLKRPGKCPVCRGESIREPRYSIEE